MKAAILNAPHNLAFVDVPDPQPEQGDLVVKVRAATICGTDIRIYRGRKIAGIRYPAVIGHEFAGEIARADGAGLFAVGQRVCVCPAIPCGRCQACKTNAENLCENLQAIGYELDGAFAEYIRIPAAALAAGNVHLIPERLSFEEASLAEPLACVLNGQQRVSLAAGETVAVLGSGPIGLLHVKLARLSGARLVMVSEPNEKRRQAALEMGADLVIDPVHEDLQSVVRAQTGGQGADVAIVAIGVPALANAALSLVRRRGRVSLFAGFSAGETAPLDVNAIHYNELIVTGAFGLTRTTFETALDLLARGRIDVRSLITRRFALAEIGDAIACAEGGDAVKVAIMQDGRSTSLVA